jgi:metallopeptidase MepB
VVILFHELGHAIHDVVSKTTYARFHGPMGTVVDFGEAPSQMLENWCWTPSQLKSLSKHYSSLSPEHLETWRKKEATKGGDATATPQPPEKHIPDSMLDSLLRSRNVHLALSHLNQLSIAIFDLTIHEPENHEAMKKMNISATFNRLKREIFPLETPWSLGEGDEWGHPYTEYRNFIGGDYHAGYYGYLLYVAWPRSLSKLLTRIPRPAGPTFTRPTCLIPTSKRTP